jgi:ABC-type polar amino acid transport system ATPase subunit
MLVAKNITKKFGDAIALHDVSLEVRPGTITSIIGPSGAGKTTLLRVLSLLDTPDSGEVTIDKKQYSFPSQAKIEAPWPNVSIVFQQLFLWPHLTIRENILLPLKVRGIDRADELKKFVELFSMEGFLDNYPNQASLGQRQRAAIVRALMLQPNYLLLDEITSALDIEQSNIILSHLDKIKEMGVGILMVAHDINFAISMADKVCFVEDGKIMKEGRPYEFLLELKNQRIAQFIDSASLGSSQIRIYSGAEEFQAYHLSLMERLPENSEIVIIGGLGTTWYGPMGDKYKKYDEIRTQKHIVWDMLMYEYGEEDRRLVKEHPEINKFYILSPSMKNMADININSDGTLLLQVFDPVPTVIEIKNKALADSYMRYYHDLIKNSKRFVG